MEDSQVKMFRVRSFDEVGSTNDLIKRAIEADEPEGLAVAALQQTAGYGRQGRTWKSPQGGMYVSVLLRPKVVMTQLPTLSLLAGVAVRRASARFIDNQTLIQIKWPNDIVVAQSHGLAEGNVSSIGKLAGISLEMHRGALCLGIGVNVFRPSEVAIQLKDNKNTPAYLQDLTERQLSIELVRTAILEEFSALYPSWIDHGFAAIQAEYEQHSFLTNRRVSVENLDGLVTVQGTVCGVDQQGHLLVLPTMPQDENLMRKKPDHLQQHKVVAVSSGEAHIMIT